MINRTISYRKSRGFTLAEALIGLVILALGLLSLARFHTNLIESSGLTKARTAAINLGQDKIEELRNLISKGEFISIDTSSEPYSYSSGSVVTTGSDTQTSTNAVYTREWNISNVPASPGDPEQATISVTVSWVDTTGITQTIELSSIIAWLDPSAGSVTTTSISDMIASIPFPAAGSVAGNGSTRLDTSLPDLTISEPAPDTTRIATTRGGILYLIDSYDVILLTATAPLTTISGIIGLTEDSETTEEELALIDVVTLDTGYCSYPLDPSTGIPDSSPSQTKAYICYVAGGWYGGVGIFGFDSDDTVCAGKSRAYRGELKATDGRVIGTVGVTANQSGDDFVITKLEDSETCNDISIPAGFTDTDSNGLPGPVTDTIVIVSTTIGTTSVSGTITIDTTSDPAATSRYTSLIVVPATSTELATDGNCDQVVHNAGDAFATYSCEVQNGWSGTITLTGADNFDKTCVNILGTPAETNIIDLSGVAVNGNLAGNNFVIVEDRVDCR